jgi:hypothetical protein
MQIPKGEQMTTFDAPTDGELYVGVAAIAAGEGLDARQVRYLIDEHDLPAFKIGRRIFARKATVREYFVERERRRLEQIARQKQEASA